MQPNCTGLRRQVTATGFGSRSRAVFRQSLLAVGVIPDFVPVRGEIRQNITLIGLGLNKPLSWSRDRDQPLRVGSLEEKVTSLAGQSLMVILSGSLPPGVPEGDMAG